MFTPRNIEKRQIDLETMKAKEARELQRLTERLTSTLSNFKNLTTDDERLHFFIDKFIDFQIKFDHVKHSNTVFFFDQKDNYLAEYDLKSQEFWISYTQIWSILESKYNLNYDQIKSLTQTWVEEHFKLRCVTTFWMMKVNSSVEEHFKFRPVTTLLANYFRQSRVEQQFKRTQTN